MKHSKNVYYAKVLLFGEYTVIFNSKALTVPFGHFSGEISFINKNRYTDYDFAVQSNKDLKNYGLFLKELHKNRELGFQFDFLRFEQDLNHGMFFESNIPIGYGIGSSGALCAGLYDEYAVDKITANTSVSNQEVFRLKDIFQKMESFFHGKSSGLDPLNCYFKTPMLLEGKDKIRFITLPSSPINHSGAIFLLNTGKSSKTSPLVEIFMDKAKDKAFSDFLHNQLIPLTNNSIEALINGQPDLFFFSLKNLSAMQVENFQPMIPSDYNGVWQEGLLSDKFYLKLCGSGGGGFLLGFTRDFSETQKILKEFQMEPIPVYRDEE